MKRILSALLALAMLLSLCAVTFAAEITPDLTGHTYTAYQIFSGTQAEDDDDLGAVEWGDGVDGEDLLAALKASTAFGDPNAFASADSAADVAAAMVDWTDSSAEAKAFAKLALDNKAGTGIAVVAGQTELDAGYYLVVDTTVGDVEVYNLALLQLTQKGTFDIETKVTVPDVEKTVNNGLICTKLDEDAADYDKDHEHTAECYNWASSDKKPIGGVEEFKIEGSVPSNVADYSYYYFILRDALSEGLTLNDDSITVSFVKTTGTGDEATTTTTTAVEDTDYTLLTGDDAGAYSFKVALIDAIDHAGETVVVNYTATVNSKAIIGSTGNKNEVDVQYSNKPDYEYTTNPTGVPAENTTDPLGETPKSLTLTYVTEISVTKVDENGAVLTDAEFTLTGETLKTILVYKEYFVEDAEGTYWKLVEKTPNGDDQYTTEAPVTADSMVATPGATAGYVIVSDDYDGDDKVVVGGVTYRAYVAETDSGKTVYILNRANTDKYDDVSKKYKKESKFESNDISSTLEISAFVDEDGYVKFTGLDAGEYTLSETKVPAGYNPLEDITFTISWTAPTDATLTAASKCTWSVDDVAAEAGVEYDAESGTFSIEIMNQKGSTLPETGGIGTTIFYVVGALFVTVAVVVLVTKKRMSSRG